MTQVEDQLHGGAAPVDQRSRRRVALGAGAGLLAALVLGGTVVLVSRGGTQTVALPPTSTIADVRQAPSTTGATTTSAAIAPTTAPAPAPSTAPGEKPLPYAGPVEELPLSADGTGPVTVARAAVGNLAVYAQPLQAPAPAFADWRFEATTQFGSPSVFLVTGVSGDWLRVRLPMKPNEIEGWVHNSEVTLAPVSTRLIVDLASRTVRFFDGAELVAESISVVGKDDTPTPTGVYYVTDLLQMEDPTTVYGPYVLATSARSDAFDLFNGGDPIVALHGTNQPSLLGSAASNGCVRLPNDIATQLASRTALGTPVFIV